MKTSIRIAVVAAALAASAAAADGLRSLRFDPVAFAEGVPLAMKGLQIMRNAGQLQQGKGTAADRGGRVPNRNCQ